MNRKQKKPTKKYVFEPKIVESNVTEVKLTEIEKEKMNRKEAEEVENDTLLGRFCPLKPAESGMGSHRFGPNFVVSLPIYCDDMKFVVFEDDSCGIKIGTSIYKLDSYPASYDSVLEKGDGIHKKMDVRKYFVLGEEIEDVWSAFFNYELVYIICYYLCD